MAKKETAEEKAKRLKEAAEKKEAEGKEAEGDKEDEAVGDPEQGDAGHDDAAKDKELIKKMVSEYVGKDVSPKEMETMEALAHEAFGAHKEMGASEQEAYERAGHALKLAKHMANKQNAMEAEKAKENENECADMKQSDDKDADDKAVDDKKESHKESAKTKTTREEELEKQLLETKGRLAALETQSKKGELDTHIEKTLRESGQPNSITKRFKEAAGDLKSKADFDSKWKIFLEGVKNTRTVLDWSPIAEKTVMQESDQTDKKHSLSLDFSMLAED